MSGLEEDGGDSSASLMTFFIIMSSSLSDFTPFFRAICRSPGTNSHADDDSASPSVAEVNSRRSSSASGGEASAALPVCSALGGDAPSASGFSGSLEVTCKVASFSCGFFCGEEASAFSLELSS